VSGMASNKIFEDIIYQINTLLKQGELYPKYMDHILEGKNDFKISQIYTKKNYSTDWIDTLEDCIISLDTIVRNPRKFIVIEEDIVDISLARSISVESVKHLSQHTNLISSVKKDGTVIPSKILNTSKEESFDIYENRFIYTLLLKIRDFIDRRFTIMKNAMMQSGDLGISIESDFAVDKNKVNCKLESSASFPFDAVVKHKNSAEPTSVERVAHINSIINDFLSSPFAKEMRVCALVRPPILRTNVILKNADFKKALVLWQFIESNENLEFNIENVTETTELPPLLSDKYRGLIFLNTILMQSIANSREEGESLKVLEEKKEEIISDQYVTKNIDDYVPDDFPFLRLDINEIRSVYHKLTNDKSLSVAEVNKMNGALDRVIRQQKINQAKEDSATQKRLIEQQLKEEEIAKKLALREQKDIARRKRQEDARRRVEAKKVEEQHNAEMRRLVKERKELEKKQKDEEQRNLKERKHLEKIQKEEMAAQLAIQEKIDAQLDKYRALEKYALDRYNQAKKDYEEAVEAFKEEEKAQEEERRIHEMAMADISIQQIAKKEESEMLVRIAKEHKESKERVDREKKETLLLLKQQSDDYWKSEKELAIKLGVEEKLGILNIKERAELEKVQSSEKQNIALIREVNKTLNDSLTADNLEHIQKLMAISRRFRSEDDIEAIIKNYEKDRKRKKKELLMRKLKLDRNANKSKTSESADKKNIIKKFKGIKLANIFAKKQNTSKLPKSKKGKK
jgi:hypothetical protein